MADTCEQKFRDCLFLEADLPHVRDAAKVNMKELEKDIGLLRLGMGGRQGDRVQGPAGPPPRRQILAGDEGLCLHGERATGGDGGPYHRHER